jgi:uncharacterized membrane protein YccF (DUF307 family)
MEKNMNCLGNIIWLIFGGFIAGIIYILGGMVLCITIIGIPFGMQAIKIGIAIFAPFGLEIRNTEDAGTMTSTILNIIWTILFGWEIAIAHLIAAIILAVTIIGLPFAKQHIKLISLSIAPFGKTLS